MKNSQILILGLFIFLMACTKESRTIIDNNMPNPGASDIPEISLQSISSNQITVHTDSIAFIIEYTDGNGDLGEIDADINSIQLIDTRDENNLIFEYYLSPRAPVDSEITITGTLEIVLQNTILLEDSNDEEATTFKIKIKDRAGNWSNVVETEVIVISRQ